MKAVPQAYLVIGVAFVVLLINAGARFAIGLLLPPMEAELGWSRTTLASSVTLFMVVTALALPFTGALVDRFGPFRVLGLGLTVASIGVGAMAAVESPMMALIWYGLVFAVGSAATSITPVGVLIARWFPERLGMANSIAISGMGIGQLLVVSTLTIYLTTLGWRTSFFALGVATLICVLPIIVLSWHKGPRGVPGLDAAAKPDVSGGPALRDVLRTRRLWLIFVVYAICGLQDFLVATHVVAFVLDIGVGDAAAGHTLALMGVAGLVGVLTAGVLNDKFGPVLPTALCFVLRIGVFATFVVVDNNAIIVVAAFLFGVTFWVTAPLTVVFARQVGHLALLGTLSGLITMVHHLAGGVGAFVGARSFDLTGTYDTAFIGGLALSVVALLLTLTLRESTSGRSLSP